MLTGLFAVLMMTNCGGGGGGSDSGGGSSPARDDTPYFSVSPTTITLETGGQATLNVTASAFWSVKSTETWLSCNPSSGNGNAQVTVSVTSPNPGQERVAALTFSDQFSTVTVQVTEKADESVGRDDYDDDKNLDKK